QLEDEPLGGLGEVRLVQVGDDDGDPAAAAGRQPAPGPVDPVADLLDGGQPPRPGRGRDVRTLQQHVGDRLGGDPRDRGDVVEGGAPHRAPGPSVDSRRSSVTGTRTSTAGSSPPASRRASTSTARRASVAGSGSTVVSDGVANQPSSSAP